jgi:hypothetical protein
MTDGLQVDESESKWGRMTDLGRARSVTDLVLDSPVFASNSALILSVEINHTLNYPKIFE